MDIILESDSTENYGALAIKRDILNPRKFIIDGKKRGNYRLVAVLRSPHPSELDEPKYATSAFTVKSNSLDLEVFP